MAPVAVSLPLAVRTYGITPEKESTMTNVIDLDAQRGPEGARPDYCGIISTALIAGDLLIGCTDVDALTQNIHSVYPEATGEEVSQAVAFARNDLGA